MIRLCMDALRDKARLTVSLVGVVGSLLVMAGLVWIMRQYTAPGPIDETRFAERIKNLREMRAADAVGLTTYDWVDKNRGTVRLKLERAMEIALADWQNPAAFRSNLLARVDKATAKLPEQPSEYE